MSIFDPSGAFIYENEDQEAGQVIQSKPYEQFNGARCWDYRQVKEGISYLESLGYKIFPPRKPFPHDQVYIAERLVGNCAVDITGTGLSVGTCRLSFFKNDLEDMLNSLPYRDRIHGFMLKTELINVFTGGNYSDDTGNFWTGLGVSVVLPDDTMITDTTNNASSQHDIYQSIIPYNNQQCTDMHCFYYQLPDIDYKSFQIQHLVDDNTLDYSEFEGMEYLKHIEESDYSEWDPVFVSIGINPDSDNTKFTMQQQGLVMYLRMEILYVHDE